jgi:hypothetical protein
MIASQGRAVVCSVLVEAWAPDSRKQWVLPCVVWERGARCHIQYPLEVVHRRERWACRCVPSDDNRQEMQVRSFSAVGVLVLSTAEVRVVLLVCVWSVSKGRGHHTQCPSGASVEVCRQGRGWAHRSGMRPVQVV